MNSSNNNGNTVYGIGLSGFCWLLTIIFTVLKLAGVIAWSWWLVFLPVLINVGLTVVLILVLLLCIGIMLAIAKIIDKDEKEEKKEKKEKNKRK